jgi:hypothetical protein
MGGSVARLAIAFFAPLLCLAGASPQEPDKPNAQSVSRVEREYDRFQNDTTFTVKSDVAEAKKCYAVRSAEVGAIHTCKGNVESCPAVYVAIDFSFITSDWTFKGADVTLLVDGARVPLGKPKWSGNVIAASSLAEHLGPIVPIAVFRKIAQAKVIEAQVGLCEFALGEDSMASFRDIFRKMDTAPKPRTPPKTEPRSAPKKADGAKN